MNNSERSRWLRDAWQLPHPVSYPENHPEPVTPPNGALYNEFDYHELGYRHVGRNAQLVLGVPGYRLESGAGDTWAGCMATSLVDLLLDKILPEIHGLFDKQRYATTDRIRLHFSYPLGKSAPYDIYEHRVFLHLSSTGRPAFHCEWIQRSSRQTDSIQVHLLCSQETEQGGQREILRRVYQPPCRFDTLLSEREKDVARLVIQGLSSAAIAERLFISRHTVDTHRRSILTKTGTSGSAELIAQAVKCNWK